MQLAADANALLSAVLGGRARLVLSHPEVEEVLTTETTFAEVQEYAPLLGRQKRIAPETLMLAVAALPVSIVAREVYGKAIPRARKVIGWRDPDDVELLAMAMHFGIPLWSNDNDFKGCGAELNTTAQLLRKLGVTGDK